MATATSLRPVDTVEFLAICRKYDVKPFLVEEYSINRYRHKATGAIYLIENHCHCANPERCDQCYEFPVLELSHHPFHARCKVCARMKKYLLAQSEFWFRYKDSIIGKEEYKYEFINQRDWSTAFGGAPKMEYEELELILDTPQKILRELLYGDKKQKAKRTYIPRFNRIN